MKFENIRKKLVNLEKSLFFAQTVLLDTANIIIKYGIKGYLSLIQQIKAHKPIKVIGKMDASAKYIIKEKFNRLVKIFKEINKKIYRRV
ncbi:hypothetical protein LCGC14_0604670 [marine sediment metagenome]|uniref:Uncharacterized protein n=1 Tax=marine sediment metagenome TaxID=412755 RepID=A0A0F9R9N9_9ZZZZ